MIIIIYGMIMFAFPIIKDPSIKTIVDSTVSSMPDSFIRVIFPFGVEAFNEIKMYSDSIHVGINIIVSIFALSLGLYSTAKEQGEGTIEYIYINPVSRSEIYFYKFFANLLNLIILCLLLWGATSFIYSYIGELEFMDILKESVDSYILILGTGFLFLALGTFISAMNKSTMNMSLLNLLIILLVLVINIVISLGVLNLQNLDFIPFSNYVELINDGIVNIGIKLLIFNVVPGILLLLLGYIIYDKKDLTI